MNLKTYLRAVEISRALKPSRQTGSRFHTSVLIRKNRIVCLGINDYNRTHLSHRFGEYKSFKFPDADYRPSLHSECSLAIRAGLESWDGLEMLNVRIDNNGAVVNSCPCLNCRRVVRALGPKRVFYSVGEEAFAELE